MYIIGILLGLYLQISIVFFIIVSLIAIISFSVLNFKFRYIICTLIICFGIVYVYILNNVYEQNTKNLYREARIQI